MLKRRYRHDEDEIETDYFLIKTRAEAGICSILYKPDRTELMRSDAAEGAFGGIYEISDLEGDPARREDAWEETGNQRQPGDIEGC